MFTLGLCGIGRNEAMSYENHALYNEGSLIFNKVHIINPNDLYFSFEERKNCLIYSGTNNISSLSALIIRSTSYKKELITVLANALNNNGCYILDSIARFGNYSNSKLLSTIDRHKRKVSVNSYFISNENQVDSVLQNINNNNMQFIAKPLEGKQGKGITLINSSKEFRNYAKSFFQDKAGDEILFFQEYVQFEKEYRVLLFNGTSLGIAEKQNESFLKNASQGGKFICSDNIEAENYVLDKCSKVGLIGVDVAQTTEGELYIIEENYAPQWQAFEIATKQNIAKNVISELLIYINN